jgi:conjugative element/phage-associated large polyvalent protein
MNDQFPPIGWTIGPGTWPSWIPNALLGGLPTSWRAATSPDTWSRSLPTEASSGATGRGILGQFDSWPTRPGSQTTGPSPWSPSLFASSLAPGASAMSAPPNSSWFRNSPSWVHSALPLGTKVGFSASPFEPAYQPWIDPQDGKNGANAWERPSPIPPSSAPVLPQHGRDGWYYPGAQLDPTPPAPPKDFRTRLREALSDENARHYAGPGFYEALQKLAALAQFLPGSGSVQAAQDASQAGEDAHAGNYGQAAAHLGMGTANAALDWLPGGKLATAILGGMGAKTFPWARLGLAERMEKAGRSVDEIWQATGLGRDAVGHWRFEISDKGYRVNPKAGVLDSEGYRAGGSSL